MSAQHVRSIALKYFVLFEELESEQFADNLYRPSLASIETVLAYLSYLTTMFVQTENLAVVEEEFALIQSYLEKALLLISTLYIIGRP